MAGRARFRFLLAGALALMLVAAACSDDEPSGDGGTTAASEGPIWVLLPDTESSDRWEKDDLPLFAAAFDAAGLVEGEDYNIVNAEGDVSTQQQQLEQAIADEASVIVLTSLDTGSGATMIDQAKEAGIEVVEYDRFNTGGSGGAAYVSFDNVQVGAKMAEAMEPAIDALGVDTPQIVMLNGGEEDNNSKLFRQGYAETVEARVAAGDWALVDDQFVPGWDNDEAQTIMEGILVDANNEVDAVFAANDGLANSTINAVEGAQFGPIPVSGQDATAAGMQNILLGKQTVSVYKPIQDEVGVAAAIALALRAGVGFEDAATGYESALPSGGSSITIIGIDAAAGEAVDAGAEGSVPYVALVPIAVTVDNIADTVIVDEFRTVEEICTGDVAQTDFCTENAA
jgi:D-xylose transport system substrate-binding protein